VVDDERRCSHIRLFERRRDQVVRCGVLQLPIILGSLAIVVPSLSEGMGETARNPSGGGSRELNALQAVLGVVMVASGVTKLVGKADQVQNFERWGYPQWFRVTTGGTETLGGSALLAGVSSPPLTILGGGLVVGTMTGAVYTHLLRVDDPASEAAKPGTLLAVAALVAGRGIRRLREAGSDASGRRTSDDGRSADE
jgi:uncharacterized membrane protein YphA (DoxX/SURF4 family)